MGYAFLSDSYAAHGGIHVALSSEDQQRINTFSKLNTRLKGIEEQIETLKVRMLATHRGVRAKVHVLGG